MADLEAKESKAKSKAKIVESQKHDIFHMYGLYFKAARLCGMLPLEFNPIEHEVKVIKSGIPRLLNRLNFIYICTFVIKQPSIVYYSYSTNYQYITMKSGFMFQYLWCFGFFLISSCFLNSFLKLKTIATTITMWLKLELHIQENLLPEPIEKRKRRIKILKIQYIIYSGAIIGCFVTLSAMAFFIPRFPPFINSILLNNQSKPYEFEQQEPEIKVLLILRKYICSILESYTGIVAWTILSHFDLLLSMMCRTISHAMDKLKELVILHDGLHENELSLYHSLRIIVTNMNLAFGKVLFLQELFSMGTTVLVLYGALNTTDSVILTAFFISNSIALTLRIYLLYLPMSNVYMQSQYFKEFIHSKLLEAREDRIAETQKRKTSSGKSIHSINGGGGGGIITDYRRESTLLSNNITTITAKDETRIEKKVATFRYMVFRPFGFHRISPTSIIDYILAVMSYLVTVKNV